MSDVATDLDTIEIDLGVIPLYHCTFITIDEVVVDALLAQPILEGDISRLENIYGATSLSLLML